MLGDKREQALSGFGAELFGVVDLVQMSKGCGVVQGKDDGGGDDRTSQRAAPGFIQSSNEGEVCLGENGRFKFQRGH
jgi:hypothetical protein